MKISVVIPYYNSLKTIKRCLTSIVKQTHKDIEVLIIDDGSDIPLNDEDIFDNMTIIRNSINLGSSKARQIGVSLATGDYITTIDADDEYSYNKLFYKCIQEIEKHNADIVQFGLKTIKNNIVVGTNIMQYGVYTTLRDRMNSTRDNGGCRFPNCCIVKAELYKSIPFIPYDVRYFEDSNLNCKLAMHANKIVSLPQIGYKYHYTEGSITNSGYKYIAYDNVIYLLDILDHMNNLSNIEEFLYTSCKRDIANKMKAINIDSKDEGAKIKIATIKYLLNKITRRS